MRPRFGSTIGTLRSAERSIRQYAKSCAAQHSGFIINRGGATATDILQLISLVQNTVYDRFGVMLEPEVRIIG